MSKPVETMEQKRQRLLDAGWKLCVYEPLPGVHPRYWEMLPTERRRRYYVCPIHYPNGFQATLRETEVEALDDVPRAYPGEDGAR